MEALQEQGDLKNCDLETQFSQFVTVSVVEAADGLATDSVTYVTADGQGTDAIEPDCHQVTPIITEESSNELIQNGAIKTEELGQQTNVPLLTTDGDAVSVSDQQVIEQYHLQIQNGFEEKGPENGEDAAEVIFVYQDVFTCGACSNQFVNLLTFLEHKTHHTIGSEFHKCDLCHNVFRSHGLITDHYHKVHRVKLDSADQPADNCQNNPQGNSEHCATAATIDHLDLVEKTQRADNIDIQNLEKVAKEIMAVALSEGLDKGDASGNEGTAAQVTEVGSNKQVVSQNGLQQIQKNLVVDSQINPQQNMTGVKNIPANKNSARHITLLKTKTGGPCGTKTKTKRISLIKADPGEHQLVKTSATNGLQIGAVSSNDNVKDEAPQAKDGGLVGPTEPLPETESRPDFNFILQTEMVKGSTFTYGKTWFKCLHCEFKTNTKLSITKHMQDEHVNLINLHQNFDMKDVTGNDKRKIMKMSAYENIFGRETRFRRRKRAKRPEKQDGPTVYKCGICGKVFTRTRYLRKHQNTHRTEKKYLCDECGKSFKSRTYLQVHRRVHKEKLFNCNQCDFKSKINAAIHAHRQVHSQGSVLCDICGYAYTDKSTLSKHKRVHDLNRPYKCNFAGCTWRFKTEVMCKAHIRAHTTEGKFKCSFCGYLFRHKHHLQRHETSMHGVKHTKTRTNQGTKTAAKKPIDLATESPPDIGDTVNLVINADGESPLELEGDGTQHLVVATDTQGTPITFEGTDLSALNVAYQTLFQNQEGSARTLIMTQPETQIIFKQEY